MDMRREGYLSINITTLKTTGPIIERILLNSQIIIIKQNEDYINVYEDLTSMYM